MPTSEKPSSATSVPLPRSSSSDGAGVTHLELLNVVLALRFRQPGWPCLLADNGYAVYAVGVGLTLASGERIVPDVLASRPSTTLAIEVKSGRDVNFDQLRRMKAATPLDLRDINGIPINEPTHHQIQVVYVVNASVFDDVAGAVSDQPVAVIGVGPRGFQVTDGLCDAALLGGLRAASLIKAPAALRVVPFDRESSLPDVAKVVLPEVIALLIQGGGTITLEGIVARTHSTVIEVMTSTGSKSEIGELRNRVADVLKDATANELADWLERVPKQPVWRFKKSLSGDQATKTRELQSLRRIGKEFIERLVGGQTQLNLLDLLEKDSK